MRRQQRQKRERQGGKGIDLVEDFLAFTILALLLEFRARVHQQRVLHLDGAESSREFCAAPIVLVYSKLRLAERLLHLLASTHLEGLFVTACLGCTYAPNELLDRADISIPRFSSCAFAIVEP